MKTRKMKKALAASALALALAAALFAAAFAAEGGFRAAGQYGVRIDGEAIGAQAVVMVPARKVGEALGFEVTWLGGGQFTMDDGTMHTTVTLGEDRYFVTTSIEGVAGMSAPFSLGVPPYCVDGVSYVPLGLFEALCGNVEGMFEIRDGRVEITRGADAAEYSKNTLILSLAEGSGKDALDALLAKYDMELLYDYESFSMCAVRLARDMTPEELDSLIAALEQEDAVLAAEKDGIAHTMDGKS